MEAATALVGVSLAAIPAIDTLIKSFKEINKEINPNSHVAKWTASADQMLHLVHTIQKYIPVDAMANFLDLCSKYVAVRNQYIESMERGEYKGLWFSSNRRKEKRDAKSLIVLAGSTTRQATRISSVAAVAASRCQMDHTSIPKNADGRCPVCCPPDLEQTRLLPNEVPNGYYTAEWRAMEDVADFVARVKQRRNSDGTQGVANNGHQASLPVETAHYSLDDGQPPQYSSNLPDQSNTENQQQEDDNLPRDMLSDEEISELVGIFTGQQRFLLLSSVPPPEEANVWASVADLRDRFRFAQGRGESGRSD
ncbi:hypothetical protein CPC08DRAFT_755637 [Agrocybe pediades]|nr:hypothetical protein CPC08DRAFT_755637 [Agrocybe pediades]